MDVSFSVTQDRPQDVLESLEQRHKIECRELTDELRALEAFADRVRSLPIDDSHQHVPKAGGSPILSMSGRSPNALDAVRDAYTSTVMSVPHYEDEYGDTYAESVLVEFGPTVGRALIDGSGFGAPCRDALLTATEQAIYEREQFLKAVDAEQTSVTEVWDILTPVIDDLRSYEGTPFDIETVGSLDAYRARLGVLSDRCDEAAASRQAAISEQRRELKLPSDDLDVPTYLYRGCETDYPVLSLIATLGDRLRGVRSQIGAAMAARA